MDAAVKVADAALDHVISIVQSDAAVLHAPVHDENRDPSSGSADKVTVEPWRKDAVQADRQRLMPAGVLVTEPGPCTVTRKVNVCGLFRYGSAARALYASKASGEVSGRQLYQVPS